MSKSAYCCCELRYRTCHGGKCCRLAGYKVSKSQVILSYMCRADTNQQFGLRVHDSKEVETIISGADVPVVVRAASMCSRHLIKLVVATKITHRFSQIYIEYNATTSKEGEKHCCYKSSTALVNSAGEVE